MEFTPEERQHYIGGSDISAIMGMNPWKTPQDVFIEKVNSDPQPFRENELMYWGKALEESIADRWLENRLENHYKIDRSQVVSTGHPTYDFIKGHPDAIFKGWRGDRQVTCLLEVKTTDSRNSSNWINNTAPPYYFAQLTWYAMINARNHQYANNHMPETEYWFAVLIGGNNYKEFMVDIDNDDMTVVESKGIDFWNNHIKAKVMPEFTEPDDNINKFLYPHVDKGKIIECDKFTKEYIDEFRSIKASIKNLQEREKKMKEYIRNKMGENQYLMYDNIKIATQLEYNKASTNWEEIARKYENDAEFCNHVKNYTKVTTIKSLR